MKRRSFMQAVLGLAALPLMPGALRAREVMDVPVRWRCYSATYKDVPVTMHENMDAAESYGHTSEVLYEGGAGTGKSLAAVRYVDLTNEAGEAMLRKHRWRYSRAGPHSYTIQPMRGR